MSDGFLESLLIIAMSASIALVMIASSEIGFQLGRRSHDKQEKEAAGSLSPLVGGLLGMLAFVLAFTFSMAASHHDARKQNVLEEANLVGTAFLRSDIIDQKYSQEIKRLLREYVDIRIQAANLEDEDMKPILERSVEIHKLLWVQASTAAMDAPNTNTSLMLQSINNVIDMHEKRVMAGVHTRIPKSIWIALVSISIFTMMTMGAQTGLYGKRRLIAVVPLTLAFAVLVALVADLDLRKTGLITVNQQAMINLQQSIKP